jgi:hypothetical protein
MVYLKSGFFAIACLTIVGAAPRQNPPAQRDTTPRQLLCPMPVARLDSVRIIPIPTDTTFDAVAMPRDTTACRNPMFSR